VERRGWLIALDPRTWTECSTVNLYPGHALKSPKEANPITPRLIESLEVAG